MPDIGELLKEPKNRVIAGVAGVVLIGAAVYMFTGGGPRTNAKVNEAVQQLQANEPPPAPPAATDEAPPEPEPVQERGAGHRMRKGPAGGGG